MDSQPPPPITQPPYFAGAAEIIAQSKFQIDSGTYAYAKVSVVPTDKHFFVTIDADEITVVTTIEKLSQLNLLERNKDDYRLIELIVSIPFYSVGFLALVSDAFAREEMNVLIVSTYSKDYVMVRADLIEKAEAILLNLGFSKAG